jgi:Transposase DDE domain
LTLLLQRIDWVNLDSLQQRKHAAGRPEHRLARGQLLAAIIFHYTVTLAGTLGEHLFWLLGIKMSESSLSERRQALPFTVFAELLGRMLRPLSKPSPEAFYKGLRLSAIDGVKFSLVNSQAVKERGHKGNNSKGRHTFAGLQCAALIELISHNPLAARLSWTGDSEWKLAQPLLDQLPKKCLLLADRLYGCADFLLGAWARLKSLEGHFLVRVKENLKIVRVINRLYDGSRIVEVKDSETGEILRVREIRARLQRDGYRPVHVRLWTSLMDEIQAPALELVQLYATRWEEELYFRELKRELKLNNVLYSQTPETAAQEVAAMIIGSSLIAEVRSNLEPGQCPTHRISFIKVWEIMEPLWLTLLLGADILTDTQKQQLCDRFHQAASQRTMGKKRTRSCPRALRRPHRPWPKKNNQPSSNAPLTASIVTA